MKKLLWPIILTILGGAAAAWVAPIEAARVEQHILGFPDTDISGHRLRPWLLGLLCMLPAIGGWIYACAGILDRYLTRQFLSSFGLCMGGLVAVFILVDLQNNASDFGEAAHPTKAALSYYAVFVPSRLVFVLPYVLLLSLLYSLGKMSRHQEIVAMIQTGRGVLRVVRPLLVAGFFCAIVCLIFNYHWGPWAEGHKKLIVDIASKGEADQATAVQFRDQESGRVWYVGAFPYQFEKTGTLHNVQVRSFDQDGSPTSQLRATTAVWHADTQQWHFSPAREVDYTAKLMPRWSEPDISIIKSWHETPHQLVKPGLNQTHLGIPELNSWLSAHHDVEWANKRPYLTQWHYRFAQPVICLVVIILAAPLGIVFSRRGLGGGVSVALFLCAGMLFTSSFSLTFGEAGHLPPMLSAWLANLIFAVVAIWLFNRRIMGRPIYDSLKKLLPSGE